VSATLRIPPSVEHVRSARLVAAAAARRAGLGEDLVDDVRLAVGEAVTRAVHRCERAGCEDDIVLTLGPASGTGVLTVEVLDAAPAHDGEHDGIGEALLAALAAEAAVDGARVTLRWHQLG